MSHQKIFTIDTLQFSKRMQKAGMKKEVSEELAKALKENISENVHDLATKQDIKDLRKEIENVYKEIDNIRKEMHAQKIELELKIEAAKKDIIIKLGSIMIAGVTILAILIKM